MSIYPYFDGNVSDDDRYYTYDVTVPPPAPSATFLTNLKTHLRLDPADTSQDSYLTFLTQAAVGFGEKYTKRTFVNTTYQLLRDTFAPCIELRRSPLVSLTSFEYLVSDVFTAVSASLYYVTDEIDYSKIVIEPDQSYPTDIDDKVQAIKIVFVAGYAASLDLIPIELQLALFNHITALYENRGDCDTASLASTLPATSRGIYDQYRILDVHL